MHKIPLLLTLLVVPFRGFSQTDSVAYLPVKTRYSFDWGNHSTSIALTQYGPRKDLVLIHLHDDEVTSLIAAQKVLERTGGVLLQLENGGNRLMSFRKSGRRFWFDPNRVFTPLGLQKNMRFLNGHVTAAAIHAVKAFAAFILENIPPPGRALIALHNNENNKYSINSYLRRGSRATDALKIHRNPFRDPDNFFIVTDAALFRQLEEGDYNVVLQNSVKARDDGSLSIYFGRRNEVYINVEAQKGRMRTQIKMLNGLLQVMALAGTANN